jgi:hypothetical protein
MSVDLEKARREGMRWLLLVALNAGRPIGAGEATLLSAIRGEYPDVTHLELRRELDYLADRKLVEISGKDAPSWHAELNRYGVDVVEYTLPCEPGIARPTKYW